MHQSGSALLSLALACAAAGPAWADSFELKSLESDYKIFADVYGPILTTLAKRRAIEDFDALALRTLLIHDYRRIALRDPGIPAAYLPRDWPGFIARRIAATLWRELFEASERWLRVNAQCPRGDLLAREAAAPRF